jgi:ORF6N domain
MDSHAPQLRILIVRGQRVLIDSDLAQLYGVQTRVLNQAVKRNADRFPVEFAFTLNRAEIMRVSQSVIPLFSLKFSNSVLVFTEHGALQAASVLNSARAVQMSLGIIRAFVKMREELSANASILKRLAEIDQSIFAHDAALRDVYQKLLPLLLPPIQKPKRKIGFNRQQE